METDPWSARSGLALCDTGPPAAGHYGGGDHASGHDYEVDPLLTNALYTNPFGAITTNFQLRLALDQPQQFTPGTNWSYAHSDYVILGLALEKITGLPLNVALRRMVLQPLGLRTTVASQTATIPQPVLHAYTSAAPS